MAPAAPPAGAPELILGELRKELTEHQFGCWFGAATLDTPHSGRIRLNVPNNFYREWIQTKYLTLLRSCVARILPGATEIEVAVQPPAAAQGPGTPTNGRSTPTRGPGTIAPASNGFERRLGPSRDLELNERYTFDNFVLGPSNRIPHAAALGVVQHPGKAYNPLFIHGSVGLGKTHLIQAICHALLERRCDTKVLYLNCESFTNDFIHALEHTDLERFRNRYRYLDILVVDDIHFLANKDRTQEEFFHTFNTLYNAGKQIVLSSDSPPGEIPTLESRLVSRFRWGMVAEIEKPVYETRFSIARRKARTMGVDMPEDAARFIAETVDSNIRELEGSVVKVVGSALIMERPVTLALVKDVLRNADNAPPRITMEEIINATTRQYQVKVSELQSKKRTQSITLPRQVCMFLARQLTGLSLEEIGGYLGGRDHTTVMYAVERILELEQRDQRLRTTIASIRDRLGA